MLFFILNNALMHQKTFGGWAILDRQGELTGNVPDVIDTWVDIVDFASSAATLRTGPNNVV